MKRVMILMSLMLLAQLLPTACSSDETLSSPTSLYAIIKPEDAQIIDIVPSDYVLTLDNIIAVNPNTGEFKMKNTERIDPKAYPIPVQYVICFYSEGKMLFSARLNSSLSSYLPSGLTFCHFLTDKDGLSRYDLGMTTIIHEDGTREDEASPQQQQGIEQMYEILRKTGKVRNFIDYDFQF